MRKNRTPSLRGSVTQNNVSVRMRAQDTSSLGVMARLGLLGGGLLLIAGFVLWLCYGEWPRQKAEDIQDAILVFTKNAQFAVKDITVEGRHRAAKDEVLDALGTETGAPIFAFDAKSAAAKLTKIEWVESAAVQRRLPDTITVTLTEREPIARWQHDDHFYVIDTSGHVLPTAHPEQFTPLPLVVGAGANDQAQSLLVLLKNYPDIQDKIDSAVRVSERRWDLHLQPKIVARLPEDDVDNALHRLSVLITQDRILDRDIVAVDLRVPDRLVIEPTVKSAPAKPAGKARS